jgi:hypothetical protein
MKLHISHLNGRQEDKEAALGTFLFDKRVSELKETQNLPIVKDDGGQYLDITHVQIPGSKPILIRGGFHPVNRQVGLYVSSEGNPLLTLLTQCPEDPYRQPVVIVRTEDGQVLQFTIDLMPDTPHC